MFRNQAHPQEDKKILEIGQNIEICKRWNSILQDSSFLKFHSKFHLMACLLTFWKNRTPTSSVFSLPLKAWYRIPFTFLPQWAFWLFSSGALLI
uniref:Uncharacterized protein n=1 Tax=Salix viminalis TaxID=40686 RepID=A0A6N2L162_SALVM